MSEQYYFNPMQSEVALLGAKTNVITAGRGTGKGLLHAWRMLECFQKMPRCTVGVVAPFAKRALTNTLPSMFEHWERWGYKRGLHWDVGHRPAKNLGWQNPYITPDNWEHYITFYNGSCAHIISQDRVGTSNSKSYDFLDIDEAKFVDFEKLKDETFPANRGQEREFGDIPFHHGLLITSDMPVTQKGSWFLRYEKENTTEINEMIRGLVAEEWKLRQRMTTPGEHIPDYLPAHYRMIVSRLRMFRRHALFYGRYASTVNMAVLGEDWIRQMRRDLPPLVFRTSILCLPVEILEDGFYSSMKPWHKYSSADFHYLDSLDYDVERLKVNDCRMDGDLQRKKPLCISFDYNANINWLVCGQPDEDKGRLNTLKSFFVKYDRKLPELVDDFCKYYEYFPVHEVIYYYDSTALNGNYAVNNQDFLWVITHQFDKHGWTVRPVAIGHPMAHQEKYLLINRGFAGDTRLVPYFNEENNPDLLVSIHTAGVYNGKKDKRGEKLAETDENRLEARTDGSDAWDTLFIGCELFPQASVLIPSSSTIL